MALFCRKGYDIHIYLKITKKHDRNHNNAHDCLLGCIRQHIVHYIPNSALIIFNMPHLRLLRLLYAYRNLNLVK